MAKSRRQSNEGLETRLDTLETGFIKYQKKFLTASITSTNVSNIADLRFNNLEIGKVYKLTGQTQLSATGAGAISNLYAVNGANTLVRWLYNRGAETGNGAVTFSNGIVFTATATTLQFDYSFSVSGSLAGGTEFTAGVCYMVLEELPSHILTAQWT